MQKIITSEKKMKLNFTTFSTSKTLLIFTIAILLNNFAFAAPPSNDNYANAIDVTGDLNAITSCAIEKTYTNAEATPDAPPHDVTPSNWNGFSPQKDVWFSFVASTEEVNITVKNVGNKYLMLALWEADGTTEISSIRFANGANNGGLNVTLSSKSLTSGKKYYFSVDRGYGPHGDFKLCVDSFVGYDFYEGALDITGDINAVTSCAIQKTYSNTSATPDPAPHNVIPSKWNAGYSTEHQVWFKFTAQTTEVNITTKPGTDSKYLMIALWEKDGTTEINSKRFSNNNTKLNIDYSKMDVVLGAKNLTPGETYYISVDSSFNSSGPFDLCIDSFLDYDWYEGAKDITSQINTDINVACTPSTETYTTIGASKDGIGGSTWLRDQATPSTLQEPKLNRWFQFTLSASSNIQITALVENYTMTDPEIALWESDGLTEIASNRYDTPVDNGPSATSDKDLSVGAVNLPPGTYYVSVDVAFETNGGEFKLCINNFMNYDFYEGAKDVTAHVENCETSSFYTNVASSQDREGDNNNPEWKVKNRYQDLETETYAYSNVWFWFTAPGTNIDIDVISEENNATNDDFIQQAHIILWDGSGQTDKNVNLIKSTVSKPDYVSWDPSVKGDVTLSVSGLTVGEKYYISIDSPTPDKSYNSASGSFKLGFTVYPSVPTLTSNSPVCVGEDAIFTITGDPGDIVTYSGAASGSTVIEADGNVDVIIPAITTSTTLNLDEVENTVCNEKISLSISETVNVGGPEEPTASVTVQPTCTAPTGTIEVTAPLGATLEYSKNGVDFQTATTFANLAPGDYQISVRDSNIPNCVTTGTTLTVNNVSGAPNVPTTTAVQPTCAVPTGTIEVTSPTGASLEYSKNGVDFQSATTFTNLDPNDYTITVRDLADITCVSVSNPVTINTAPSKPAIPTVENVLQPTCAIPSGSITFTTQTDVEYSIGGNFQTSPLFENLSSGAYTLTVRNIGDTTCTTNATDTVTINEVDGKPNTPIVNNVTQPTCAIPSGSITFTTQTDVEYSIGGNFQTSPLFENLAPNTYTLTVRSTDDTTCTTDATETVTINPLPAYPEKPTASIIRQPTCDIETGTILITAPSGSTLEYSIDGIDYQASRTFSNLSPGNYTVSVREAGDNTCVTFGETLTIVEMPEKLCLGIPNGFSPNGDGINDVFEIKLLEAYPNFEMQIFNRYGNKVYDYRRNGDLEPKWWDGYSSEGSTLGSGLLPAGTYFYTINYNSGDREPISKWVYLNY